MQIQSELNQFISYAFANELSKFYSCTILQLDLPDCGTHTSQLTAKTRKFIVIATQCFQCQTPQTTFGASVRNNFPNDHETVSDSILFPGLTGPTGYLDVLSVVLAVDSPKM